jgi:hypothetical protein
MYSSVEITKHAAPKNARFDAARMSRIGRAATIGSAWLFPALRFSQFVCAAVCCCRACAPPLARRSDSGR